MSHLFTSNQRNFVLAILLMISSVSLNAAELRIEIDDLYQQLQSADHEIHLIDARSSEDYLHRHLPGAVSLPVQQTYDNSQLNGRVRSPADMQQQFRQAGLSTGQAIVVYDDGSMVDAARLFWTLEVYGFDNVKVLNGGFALWQQSNLPTDNLPAKITPSDYVVRVNNQRLASKFTTQLASINPNQTIIDARPVAAYQGKTSTAQRFGHIPSAININFHENLQPLQNQSRRLNSMEKLSEVYAAVPKHQKIIIYCEAGKVSSTTYLTLRELGYDVANYDASWREWGNDLSLPIVSPGD